MRKLTIIIAITLTACSATTDNYAYKATCTNGTITDTFDVDGSDYDGNQYTRQQAIQQLQDALSDDTSYEGNWTCK